MKIGIDARLYRSATSGIGRYSQNLIKNILELDRENDYTLIMTPEDRAEFEKSSLAKTNVRIIETDIKHYSLAEQTKLPKILAQEKFDLVHFLNFNVPVGYKGKFVVTIHDLILFFFPGRSKKSLFYKIAYKYIFGKSCRNASKIIAVSDATKKDILKTFKTPAEKIAVVHEAADDKGFNAPPQRLIDELKSEYKITDQPVLLYVGQWRPHKNLVSLIRAFELLRKDLPAKLAIVGPVDPAYPEVSETIDKSPFLRDIIRPGFKTGDDLAAWYKVATVFIFPSFYEGFGLPGLEAMTAGVPVISSNRTSLPEIYRDAAVYFDPDNPQEMKDRIKEILTDKNLRDDLIKKGDELVKTYSWARCAKETLKIYQSIKN